MHLLEPTRILRGLSVVMIWMDYQLGFTQAACCRLWSSGKENDRVRGAPGEEF